MPTKVVPSPQLSVLNWSSVQVTFSLTSFIIFLLGIALGPSIYLNSATVISALLLVWSQLLKQTEVVSANS